MKIMTVTNVSYRGEMYQVTSRTFFIPHLEHEFSCGDHSVDVLRFPRIFFPRKMLIDRTCLFVVKVSIYQTFLSLIPVQLPSLRINGPEDT